MMGSTTTIPTPPAVREAAINAIKHGNGMDPKKRVRVTFTFDDDILAWRFATAARA